MKSLMAARKLPARSANVGTAPRANNSPGERSTLVLLGEVGAITHRTPRALLHNHRRRPPYTGPGSFGVPGNGRGDLARAHDYLRLSMSLFDQANPDVNLATLRQGFVRWRRLFPHETRRGLTHWSRFGRTRLTGKRARPETLCKPFLPLAHLREETDCSPRPV